jgi:hypothetical protein
VNFFQFHDFNHCPQGKIAIEDIVAIMGHQMIALGHRVGWPGEANFLNSAGSLNVLLEAFTDEGCIERIAAAHANGARFLYIATEEPTPLGFNSGNAWGMIDRMHVFPEAARYADAILHLVPGVTEWYSRFAPSAYAELGYAPGLADDGADDAAEPEYDFGFYGQSTPRREKIFERLCGYGSLLTEYRLELPRRERDAMMRHAKVIVQVRAQDNVEYVSSTRCVTALLLGRPVVAEPHSMRHGWDEVIHFSDDYDSFCQDARTATYEWRAIRAGQLARLARVLPPEFCLGRALTAVGIT